ncbi:MAG: peptidase [Coleofasciculaceae cyanobacterium RL_1_1]|nr:peptidase [Coleofasciculaceae cyanobacterium RL_1_1]
MVNRIRQRIGRRIAIAVLTLCITLFNAGSVRGNSDQVPFAAHPAPPGLAPWRDQSGDYFDEIGSLPFGALVWSHWPVRVSIDPTAPLDWQADVRTALDNWQTYVPLTIVSESEAITPEGLASFETSETQMADALTVDIAIVRMIVPAQPAANGLLRAASARATFSLFVVRDRGGLEDEAESGAGAATGATTRAGVDRERFGHRFVIRVSPTQTGAFVQSAVRHEFGHALGIWGHSPNPQDVMFAAQVAQPGTVSTRDVNTLMRVYEQPTRLGWWIDRQATP